MHIILNIIKILANTDKDIVMLWMINDERTILYTIVSKKEKKETLKAKISHLKCY